MHSDDELRALIARLTLDEKAALCSGADTWHTHPIERIGLDAVAMSDGPAGIRGTDTENAERRLAGPGELPVSFPAPSALAANWDVALAAEFGRALGSEAVRERVDVVLAPVVNLQRTPLGGRHFECFSEDPLLTGEIGLAVVQGIQSCGVAACVKHFAGNESETRRTTSVSRIDERTLREVYLAPFERILGPDGAWAVMAAYNGLDAGGVVAKAVAHPWLLDTVLREEWDYQGAVISDWSAATDTVSTARHGLDLVMPGPDTVWSSGRLADAVRRGDVDEADVDRKVLHMLRLAARLGALGERRRTQPVSTADARRLSATIAARAMVVLRDERGSLPVGAAPRSVALIGPNAVAPYLQGGGSASIPIRPARPLADEFASRWPGAAIHVEGAVAARRNPPAIDPRALRDPRTGASGVRLEALDAQGRVIDSWVDARWPGVVRALPRTVADVRVSAVVRLAASGEHWLGCAVVGAHRVHIDGVQVSASASRVGEEVVLDSTSNSPPAVGRAVRVSEPRDVLVEALVQNVDAGGFGVFARAGLHHRPPGPSEAERIASAAALAASSELVVVVVGTNEDVESEGWDRTSLVLPGAQDALVDAVLDARPDAIVVVNAGAPVGLPWLDRAQTVLWAWLPGQEFAVALADVLTGAVEPAGRLPWTLPASLDAAPVADGVPDPSDVVVYREGLDVGYRGWLRSGYRPALAFGHGLGWTRWEYDGGTCRWDEGGLVVECAVRNVGRRDGREVVQVYAETDAPGDPVRRLVGFATIDLGAGARADVSVRIVRRALEVWDESAHAWSLPSGDVRILVGRSVDDIRLELATTP